MARLPTTVGERAIPRSRQGVASVRPGGSSEALYRGAQAIESATQGLSRNLMQVHENALRQDEEKSKLAYAQAKSKFLRDQIAIESSFDSDQDWATFGSRYDERIKKAKTDAAASIGDPRARAFFEADVEVDIARGMSTITSKSRAKETDSARAGLNDTISNNLQSILTQKDPALQQSVFRATGSAIDSAAKAGYITAQEAQQQKQKFAEDYAAQSIALLPPSERLQKLVPGNQIPVTPEAGQITGKSLLPITTENAIGSAAKGADADILKRIATLESNGNPDAVNPQSGASGAFQFMPETAKQYGLTDPKDPKASAKAAAQLLNDNRTVLRATLGREPSPGELYLAHQQGATGASALLANPDNLAVVTLAGVYGSYDKAKAAIVQNGGNENMTSGQFASIWVSKFEGKQAVISADYEIPSGGYDFSQKTGTPVDFLPVDQRMRLIEQSLVDLKQERDRARISAQVDIALSYDDVRQNAFMTGEVDQTFVAKTLAAYPDDKGAKMVQALNDAAKTGTDTRLMQSQTLAQDQAMLDEASQAASVSGPGSAAAAERLTRLNTVYDQKIKALQDDPANYVRTVNPAVADAWAAATGEGATSHDLRTAISLTEAEQQRLGVPPGAVRMLPKDVAQSYVDRFNEAKPEEAADMVEQMQKDFGPQWGSVLRDLKDAKMPSYAVVLGTLDRPEQAIFRTDLIEANKIGVEGIQKMLPGSPNASDSPARKIDDALDLGLADFSATVTPQTGGIDTFSAYRDAIKAVALYGYAKGKYDTPEKAVEDATNAIVGHYQLFDTYRVPDTYDGTKVDDGLTYIKSNLKGSDILPMDMEANVGLSSQFLGEQTAKALSEQGIWVTNEDETGVYLIAPNGNPALRPDGSLFMVPFVMAEQSKAPHHSIRWRGVRQAP